MYEPKIAACVICRGIEETLPDLIRSIKSHGIDFLNVTLNQQQEEKQILDTCKEVGLDCNITKFDWCDDTGKSRQFNLEQLPPEYDWLIWLDSDDTIESNNKATVRDIVKKMMDRNEDIMWLWYHYSFDESDNPTNMFIRERILRTAITGAEGSKFLHWKGIIHEVLVNCENYKNTRTDDIHIKHHPKEEDRKNRNAVQLEKALAENPENVRFIMYMAHHYSASGNTMMAYHWYLKFAEDLRGSLEERWQAYHYAAGCARTLGLFSDAETAALQAVALMPEIVDPYIELGIINYHKGDYDKAQFWFKECATKRKGSDLVFFNPMYVTNEKDVYNALTLGAKGEFVPALNLMREVSQRSSKNPNYVEMLKRFKEANLREETVRGIKALSVVLLQHGEIEKLNKVIDIVPWWLEEIPSEYYTLVDGIKKHAALLTPEGQKKFYETFNMGKGHWADPDHPRYKWLVAKCNELCPKGGKILDVGGGIGILAEQLTNHEVLVIEPNADNCAVVREKGIKCVQKFFQDFKAKEHFDIVIMTEYLEHVLNPKADVDKALELGKHLLITVPRPTRGSQDKIESIQDHLRIFTLTDIENLVTTKEGRRLEEMLVLDSNTSDMQQVCAHISHRAWDKSALRWKFYENATPENWCPNTNVVGGSELAFREVASALDKRGDTVFAYYKGDKRVYNGIPFRPVSMYPAGMPCDVVVSSRSPHLFSNELEGKKKYLWAHDVGYGEAYTKELEDKIDGVLLESDFHKTKWMAQYPWSNKTHVVGGGITTELFTVKEKPYTDEPIFVYASSPVRGLETLLMTWPEILKIYPKAELHVFYGWEWFDKAQMNLVFPNLKKNILSAMASLAPSVIYHGRVPHETLVKFMCEEANIWFYPPNQFEEVYCAQAVEVQAAGVMCFYRPNGALPEVVGSRGIILPMDSTLTDVVQLLKDNYTPENYAKLTEEGRKWAMTQSWSEVAEKIRCLANGA